MRTKILKHIDMRTKIFTIILLLLSVITYSLTPSICGGRNLIWTSGGWSAGGTQPTSIDNVTLNADYNTSIHGNIDACELKISKGNVLTISDNTYINVINSINNLGTINVSTKGNLIQENSGPNIIVPFINITKTTSIKKRWDYEYMSKPLENSVNIIPSLNPFFDLKYYWDGGFASIGRSYLGWGYINSESQITTGSGYIARVRNIPPYNVNGDVITFTLSGLTTNGDYTSPVKYFDTANDFRNFSLLGNPYPGSISFEKFYNDNKDKILGTAYLWTSRTYYPGSGEYNRNSVSTDYATFNLTGGVGPGGTGTQATLGSDTPNGYIASEQGFMVRAKGVGSNTTVKKIIFKNSHRIKSIIGGVNTNGQFFRMGISEESKNRYWLRINDSQNNYNEILIGYLPDATDGLDDGYDSTNITSWVIKLHSLVDNEKLVIQGKDDFHFRDKISLMYEKSTTINETLTISLETKEGIFENNQKIYLFDKILNKYHRLTDKPYSFRTDKKNEENRFEIRYYPLLVDDNGNLLENTETTLIYFIKNKKLNLESSESIKAFNLFDINGRLVLSKIVENDCNSLSENVNLSGGVYILSVTLVNGKIYIKKIVQQ